ncbi:MAG: CTP synthetase [Rhodobacteraceae bacterium]|nr:CTP synthetase [Paracoccaceae bacterium]
MLRLALLLYSLIATTLAGTAVVVALVAGFDDLHGILLAAALGFAAAVPASLLVANRLVRA